MEVSGNRDAFDFFFTPSKFARDDLAVLPYSFRVTLRVLVFDIDCRREGTDSVSIDCAQVLVQPAVFFSSLFDLLDQPVIMNSDADVPHHGLNELAFLVTEWFFG